MLVETSDLTFFHFLIDRKSRFPPKKFYIIEYRAASFKHFTVYLEPLEICASWFGPTFIHASAGNNKIRTRQIRERATPQRIVNSGFYGKETEKEVNLTG